MELNKRFIAFIATLAIVVNFLMFSTVQIFAHDTVLDVEYDDCVFDEQNHLIDDAWYFLDRNNTVCYHLDEETTIKYYFEDPSPDDVEAWAEEGPSDEIVQDIKNAYAYSMKKWNNIYFYSYDDYGVLTKHKIVNVVEGTALDHNLSIYLVSGSEFNAITDDIYSDEDEDFGLENNLLHYHVSEWEMKVYVKNFYTNASTTSASVTKNRERTGAHEIGHILGLFDADTECDSGNGQYHHDVLMGYTGCPDITYKDIAGAAITRGFHTDNDHKWLNCGMQSNGKYKLVCSICNGVKNVSSLSGYTYNTYGVCGNNHSLSSGNMMAVASYGNKDYYKCEYCRYVAPFDSNVTQNYTKTYQGNNIDKYVNTVSGLEYTFYQEHTHSYHYEWQSVGRHTASCDCGLSRTESHTAVPGSFGGPTGYGICMYCHGRVSMGTLLSVPEGLAHTDNGSYILPNGNIILVEEDVEAYLAGTLEFYYGEKE